ncbi:MAG TPA: sugar ABC transporter permease [Acholeplasmataceae bacterium]|nr:sugar ABC transporter permease [Acholeplasmataceae bacterium]
MKRNKSILKILKLLLVGVLLLGVATLSGCVKKSDDVYFLRSVVKEHSIEFQDGNSADYVTGNVGLATNYEGVTISWKSSNPNLVTTNGVVTLPSKDEVVTLTGTYSIGNHLKTKKFELNLISQESIDNTKYLDALNKVLLLETRNNQTNYDSAKEALNLVPMTHASRQALVDRFLVQEKIRETDDLVKAFLYLPTTPVYTTLLARLNSLPAHNQYVLQYKTQIAEVQPHLVVGDKVKALIDNKTQAAYDEALAEVEALPGDLPSKYSLNNNLTLVKKYLNDVAKLNLNDATSEELEAIIKQSVGNPTLNNDDKANLRTLFNNNQQRLFAALEDGGRAYILGVIEQLRVPNTLTVEDIFLLQHLIDNFAGPEQAELLAKFKILVLSKDINSANIAAAKAANNAVTNQAVKTENAGFIADFELALTLETKFNELEALKEGTVNFETLKAKIVEVKTAGANLTLERNINWFNDNFEVYGVVKQVIDGASEILTIPLAYTGNNLHPLVQKISDTKVINNSTILSDETHLRSQLSKVIEMNTLARLEELKALNEAEETEGNRVLIGQLLGQTVARDYGTYMMRSYKEKLDSDVRLSQSSALVGKILLIFVLIVVFFVSQAMTADYASKKGYEGIVASLISLIPIGGWLYFYKQPKRRNISKSGIRSVYKPSEVFAKLAIYGQIVLTAVIVIVPIIYIFGMAFSNLKTDIPNQIWPTNPNWESFNYLFNETKFKTWWLNTVSIALINMLIGTVLITGASYVFARFNFKGKKAGLMTILVLQSFPSFMGLIAMYVLFWKFGLLGQPLALTILYIGGGIPGNIWLIKGFMDQIPKDLDESAMIDGANKLQIFFRIIMPLAVPILTFVAVNMFMAPWMDYMLPGYLLNIPRAGAPIDFDITEQWTLAVGLFKLINDPNTLNYSAFAAGALIVGIPITLLYMFFQKYLIEGIMAGATKG